MLSCESNTSMEGAVVSWVVVPHSGHIVVSTLRSLAVAGSGSEVDPDTPQARGDAAGAMPTGGQGPGRPGLDRRRVLAAAVQFIDQHGLSALMMRRLGAHLGVEAMALYRTCPAGKA